MDNHLFKSEMLYVEANSDLDYESDHELSSETGNGTERKIKSEVLPQKPAQPQENENEENFTTAELHEVLERKSVICSMKDATLRRETSDGEESSGGSSLILDEDSDNGDDSAKQLDAEVEPSVDPSEIECVVTDTSGDESCDSDERDSTDTKGQSQVKQYSCSLCAYVASDSEGLGEFLKHLQTSHKFAVRGLRDLNSTAETEDDTRDRVNHKQKQQKRWFTCCKNNGGCGTVFFSKQGLLSHHVRSKTAGGTCWHAGMNEQGRTPLSCTICSFQCTSRRRMLEHLKTEHNGHRDSHLAMDAFSLSCRICDAQFWTAAKRSQHEVLEHSDEASYLMLKCYVCYQSYSSKVCLKRHMIHDHSDEELVFGSIGFRCRMCYIMFPSFILAQEHFQRSHSSLLVYRCQKCSLILKTKKTYLFHLKNTQCGSIRQECTLCMKILWSKRALSIHHRMKHSSSTRVGFLCRICKQRFESKSERTQHYADDHQGDSPFSCPICHKGFASKSGMYGHRQTHVKMSLSKCEFCGKEFSRRDSYNEHLLIHNGPRHKCPHCDKEFVQRSNLVRHIRIHTGEKPYKCSFCEKTFSDKGACNSHIRVHTREEACGCPYCGQIFSKKQKLKYHIRKHTGEGLVSCEFCGKTFTNSHSLKEHRMIHDHRTQIMCTQCGKAFSTAKYLQRHVSMVHEAILVYRCPLCSRGFSQLARLKTHIMTHSGIKHLRCLLCTKAYSSQKSLRSHLLNIHSVTTEHPDYKQCFYAMSPEEAGLKIPDGHTFSKQPLLRPKSEPLSANSDLDSENNESSSVDEGETDDGNDYDDDGPPKLVQQDPLSSSLPHPSPFSTIRTKAARKQLPFNVIVTEKKVDIVPNCHGFKSKGKKTVKAGKVNLSRTNGAGKQGCKQACPKDKLCKNTNLQESSDSSSSESYKFRSTDSSHVKVLEKVKLKKKSRSMAHQNGLVTRAERLNDGDAKQSGSLNKLFLKKSQAASNSNQFESVSKSLELSKSNRRARYKLQAPKKHVISDSAELDTSDAKVLEKP